MFLVLGMPRSRTAWMSVFLGCPHEAIEGCTSLAEYKDKIKNTGDSNTAIATLDFEPYFTDIPKVIIHKEISQSMIEYGMSVNNQSYQFNLDFLIWYQHRLNQIQGLHINFAQINNKLECIWNYVKHEPYQKALGERLISINIQVQQPYQYDFESAVQLMRNEQCLYPTTN